MADKYLLDQLKRDCSREIENHVNSDNANKVLEFASKFNHNELKTICFETLKSMFENDPVEGSKLLLVLHRNWLIELLNIISASKERLRELFIKKHFSDVKISFDKHKKT